MEHVCCTEHSVALRVAAGRAADGCAFRALSSVDLSQPLFPGPRATVAVPASPAVPSL